MMPVSGGGWTETVLHSFLYGSSDGSQPNGGLILDSAGNLYGTTTYGGPNFYGAVFEMSPVSGGGWSEKVLYSFSENTRDGSGPQAGLVFDASGNLYSTTYYGGTAGTLGKGAVFQLTPTSGGGWSERVVSSFPDTATDGANPQAGLIFDASGNLYGTTYYGGNALSCSSNKGCGTVFEIPKETTVLSPLLPVFYGAPATFMATVTAIAAAPSGTVTLMDGTATLGTQVLNGSGVATLTTSALTVGNHTITAVYGGDSVLAPSTSASLVQVVSPADFSLLQSPVAPITVKPGQSATSPATIESEGALSHSVSLTCSVSPTASLAPTCAFHPTSLTVSVGESAKSTLTISTTGAMAARNHDVRPRSLRLLFSLLWLPIAGFAMAGVGVTSHQSSKRKVIGTVLAFLVVTGFVFLTACGGGSSGASGSAGTPAGSYTVTVTAQSGSTKHSTTVTLTVE
jgi:uncharacterized repeat protein (TIGR03803 family)